MNALLCEDWCATVRTLYVRGLTPETHGNAVGMGLADVVATRLVEAIDPHSTYTNALSAMTPALASELRGHDLRVVSPASDWAFDAAGDLDPAADLPLAGAAA